MFLLPIIILRLVSGINFHRRGVFQTLTTTYAAEVCPVALRPYLTTYVNLCWVIGQLIASGVLKAFVTNTSQWAYRIPFAIQWIWPVPIFIASYLAPESPWSVPLVLSWRLLLLIAFATGGLSGTAKLTRHVRRFES